MVYVTFVKTSEGEPGVITMEGDILEPVVEDTVDKDGKCVVKTEVEPDE